MLKIKQFYDHELAQASYTVLSQGQVVVIDPARNPKPYLEWAQENGAEVVAVIETHSHADFVSAHLEIHRKTGATIYCSGKTDAAYPHEAFDGGKRIKIGNLQLQALDTPGHSPDSISVLVIDEKGKQHSVFTGDALFVGDVGRPDLRADEQDPATKQETLARQLFQSIRAVLMQLDREVMVYPAHGAGSLCGHQIGEERTSTIGREMESNWAMQEPSEEAFVQKILGHQLFIPKYFKHCIKLNKMGAPDLESSLASVPRLSEETPLEPGVLVVDTRDQLRFKNQHMKGAINLMEGAKFETWLGCIVDPGESFYLIGDDAGLLERLGERTAKIGYEQNLKGVQLRTLPGGEHDRFLILEHFKTAPQNYTIVDVRSENESKAGKIFDHAISIPLHQLRERAHEIPLEKPIAVHCAAGYRSAAAFSILEKELPQAQVYDIGEAIKDYILL